MFSFPLYAVYMADAERRRVNASIAHELRTPLIVRDDGSGFTREARENAGIPFQKERKKEGHYGMGLYLCRLLCEKHGGEMEIAGEPGQGAAVRAVFGAGSGRNPKDTDSKYSVNLSKNRM